MKTLKRIGLLILSSVIGAFVFFIFALASVNGMFVQWENLGKPPETPVEIIRPGYVKTDNGNIYQYIFYDQDCNSGCWKKIEAIPDNTEDYEKPSTCGNLPSLDNYVDSKADCQFWGVGTSLTIYAIGKDDSVYYWEHSIGEGDSMMLIFYPFWGAVGGFFVGVIGILIGLYSDLLEWLRQRAIKKGL